MLRLTSVRLFSIIALLAFAAGCAGVQAKTYVMRKDRVNITYSGGNAGYVMGKPQFVEPEKKTRKVYILELTKPVAENEVKKVQEETITQTQAAAEQQAPPAPQANPGPVVIAPTENQAAAQAAAEVAAATRDTPAAESSGSSAGGGVSYTVMKDDTLQKISKKFYSSYGKWIRIYDANKSKIKNPNFVKPGTVLTIPPADEKK